MESEFVVENENVTEEVMIQYEAIRQLGPCNMFDFSGVISNCHRLGFRDLENLSLDDYKYILNNFSKLMKYYEIAQTKETVKMALAIFAN